MRNKRSPLKDRPLWSGTRSNRSTALLRSRRDVVGDGFNVDHVLIGPAGVFTVETKTHSKPRGDARVVFDGEAIQVAGMEPDRDPVVQARGRRPAG